MMRQRKWLGHGARLGVLAICVLAIGVSISRAQIRPPVGPPPGGIGGGGPKIQPPPIPPLPQPPVIPPPVINPPLPPVVNVPVMEWYCTRCRGVLARGGPEPVHITTCPHCGARFTNGGGPNFDANPAPPPVNVNPPPPILQPGNFNANPPNNRPSNIGRVIVIIALSSLCLLMVFASLGIVGIMYLCGSGGASKKAKKRKRPRDYDD
jgi:hypothetical protein